MSEWVKGTVVGKHQWSDDLFSMHLDAPVIDFKAGQYTEVALDIGGDRIGRPYSLVDAPERVRWRSGETLIYCHPGKNQHGKRKARFPLSFISNVLQTSKMATHPCVAGNANKSAFP